MTATYASQFRVAQLWMTFTWPVLARGAKRYGNDNRESQVPSDPFETIEVSACAYSGLLLIHPSPRCPTYVDLCRGFAWNDVVALPEGFLSDLTSLLCICECTKPLRWVARCRVGTAKGRCRYQGTLDIY